MRHFISLLVLGVIPGLAADTGRSLPLFFFPNVGQTGSSIRFIAETPEVLAGFGAGSVTFRMRDQEIRVRFSHANPRAAIEGQGLMPGKANFLAGNDANDWKRNVPLYEEIVYHELYPGIDMTYGTAGNRLKSQFLVAPGADPAMIRLDYDGAEQLLIDSEGALVVRRAPMELRELSPEVYQESHGVRVPIKSRFRLISPRTVGFELGPYDRLKPLIIDPVVSYCTYLGGTGIGSVTGVAVDASDNLYVTGWTEALNFPIAGAPQSTNGGSVDAFVLKLNAAGTAIIYATYVGGRGDDRGAGIAVDSSGQTYVTGYTQSTNFPVVSALRTTLSGSRNAFALKLNPAGSAFVYSTYLGGSNYDMGNAIAVDSTGNAYIAGDTYSTDFPVLHPVQSSLGGLADAFVAKLTPAGAISFSTFLGGSNNDHAGGIAVDSSGNAYVGGGTFSTNFPVSGAIQTALGGGENGFATKISTSASTLVYSTYLGGNGGSPATPEQVNAIAVDSTGNAYVAGVTNSTNFPVTSTAFQPAYDGDQDAFVAKINTAGSALVFSTYLGGSSFDWANGVAADSSGNAYVGGYTLSADFPTDGGVQDALAGLYDAFISKLNPTGSALLYSTYYGGTGSDTANALAIDSSGNIFVGGQTSSYDLPLQGAIQTTNNGGSTGWLMRLGFVVPPQPPQAVSVTPATGSGSTQTFTFVFSDPLGAADLSSVQALFSTSSSNVSACNISVNPAQGTFSLANDAGTAFSTAINLGASGTLQNSSCTVSGAGSGVTSSGNSLTLNLSVTFLAAFNGAKNTYGFAQSAGGQNSGWVQLGTYTASVTVASQPPQVVSVTPSAATGTTQTFSFVFTDVLGAADINTVFVGFGTSIWGANSCFIQLYPNYTVSLANDATVTWMTPITLGTSATTQNSQCTLSGALSNITPSGSTLTLNLGLTFQATFSGAKTIYATVLSTAGLSSSWQQVGTYTVSTVTLPMAAAPVFAPVAGTYGSAQSVTLSTSTVGASIRYTTNGSAPTETTGTLYSSPFTVSSSETLEAITYETGMTDSAVVSAAYTISVPVAAPVFTPVAGTYSAAQSVTISTATAGASIRYTTDGSTPSETAGTLYGSAFTVSSSETVKAIAYKTGMTDSAIISAGYTIVVPQAPQAVSVAPASGTGNIQTFSFVFSDPNGASDINALQTAVNTSVNGASSCFTYVDPIHGTILLANDSFTVWLGPITPGEAATLQNSQCTVNGSGSSLSSSGNSVTLKLSLTFQPAFAGAKSVFGNVQSVSGLTPGWQTLGSYTVSGTIAPQPPQAVSVTPSSGGGSSQTFSFVFSDPNGASDINALQTAVNTSVNGANSCFTDVDPIHGTILLANDSFTVWLGPITPGSAATLQNSQCTVNGSGSSISPSGNSVTVKLSLTFQPAFAGAKSVFGNVQSASGLTPGWQTLGSYTVSGTIAPQPPQAVSVTPSSGGGSSQTFSFVFSDPNGASDINALQTAVNTSVNGANSCFTDVDPIHGTILLANDSFTVWLGPITPGSAATLQNSQCTVNGSGSSISSSGNSVTVKLSLTFQPAFAGAKTLFANVQSVGGLTPGWQTLGTWIP